MRNRSKLLLAGLTAALALGALVSAASANRIGIRNTNTQWRMTWNAFRFIGFGIECHVTLEGSYHSRTLSKVINQLIGYVTKAIVDETHCTGGSARILTEKLPWHIRYAGFVGTLPNIADVTQLWIGQAIRSQTIEPFGAALICLYASSAASPMRGSVEVNTATGVAESFTPEAAPIPKTSGGALCGESVRLEGASTALTQEATATKISVTLVQ